MLRIRTVRDVDDFVDAPNDPTDYSGSVMSLWESGASRPDWCFVLEDETGRVGRLGFRVSPTTTDPRWLGSLPPEELFIYGLELPWRQEFNEPGRFLLLEAVARIGADLPEILELQVNAEVHPQADRRVQWAQHMALPLFQEKLGFVWVDPGRPVQVPERFTARTIAEVGADTYRSVMAPCGAGTLDRNDRYYWEGCGADNWAAQMTAYLEGDDESLWLLGYDGAEPVGYIAIARQPDWGATIVHVGVVPERRGRGFVHDLLAAGTRATQDIGIASMLSDVDVLNAPMIEAMRRANHLDGRRPWHRWVYRVPLVDLA